MKALKKKGFKIVADLALRATSNTVNSACRIMLYQPKLPQGAERLRRK